jgi:glucuronate isomerase
MNPDRFFAGDEKRRALARELYAAIADLPLICPHGHVDPRLFADPAYQFGSPAELFIIPDHYVTRMLYSQGIALERLGVETLPGREIEVAGDPRAIWQLFADHFYLFRGTPTGVWIQAELSELFDVSEKLNSASAQRIYDQVAERLATPAYRPRALYERFNIEALCTTDAATATLEHHRAIQQSEWSQPPAAKMQRGKRILPTFRPDGVVNLDAADWRGNIARLSEVSGVDVHNYRTFVQALEQRRTFFKAMGATATDHAAVTAKTLHLSNAEADAIFQRALTGRASSEDAGQFTAHMLLEMARMSSEEGLVMQLHAGSLRNHNPFIFANFGPDQGADIPVAGEYTRNLHPLLQNFGNHRNFRLILFTLDETTYARELAPLAGHYPAVKLGPPWWFYDSLNGIARFFDQVMETAGIYNTVGFNDDTRAFCSIPARHDVWRRASANWLAGLTAEGQIDLDDAHEMARALAYDLAKEGYGLVG